MTLWFIFDLYFGYVNVIVYLGCFWVDVDCMDVGLVDWWNDAVGFVDIVWVLGDVVMGWIAALLLLVVWLHGCKLLLVGNYDRCWVGYGDKVVGWIECYFEVGFVVVY